MTFAEPLRLLLARLRNFRGQIWWASTCSILNKLLDLAPPLLIGLAIDVVVEGEKSWLASVGVQDKMTQLWVVGGLTLLVWGLESVFEYAFGVLWRTLAQQVQHETRMETYQHVQRMDLAFFETRQSGDLLATLNDDINQLERFLDGGANDLLQVATTVITVGGIFFFVSWKVALLAFAPIPLIIWGSFLFQAKIATPYQKVRDQAGSLNAALSGNLAGIQTIKSFTAEEHESERVRSYSLDYQQANSVAIRLSSAFSPLIRMAVVIGFLGTLLYGGHLTLQGTLAVGSYGVLVFLTQRLLWPLTRLGATFDLYQRAMASTKRVLRVLQTEANIISGEHTLLASHASSDIQFNKVTFSFAKRESLFKELSLHFPSGQTTGIVGTTGAGKTSVIKLLQRFYDPQEGEICIGGSSIDTFTLESLRQHIAYVPQETFLFDGTIEDNVRYGKMNATDSEVAHAAEVAEVSTFAAALPDGMNTRVGERGMRLSGGQRQRISFARALLKNAPILVLDEATSAVDNQTEEAMQRALKKASHERTVIVVAHRLSTVRDAHQILVMENGALVESGAHDALLNQNGRYAKLWRIQSAET